MEARGLDAAKFREKAEAMQGEHDAALGALEAQVQGLEAELQALPPCMPSRWLLQCCGITPAFERMALPCGMASNSAMPG